MLQDVDFASIMIQNLNNNLITAPELAELRKRLRNLETKVRLTLILDNTVSYVILGWPDILRGVISFMVPQRSRDFFALPACAGV